MGKHLQSVGKITYIFKIVKKSTLCVRVSLLNLWIANAMILGGFYTVQLELEFLA